MIVIGEKVWRWDFKKLKLFRRYPGGDKTLIKTVSVKDIFQEFIQRTTEKNWSQVRRRIQGHPQ